MLLGKQLPYLVQAIYGIRYSFPFLLLWTLAYTDSMIQYKYEAEDNDIHAHNVTVHIYLSSIPANRDIISRHQSGELHYRITSRGCV